MERRFNLIRQREGYWWVYGLYKGRMVVIGCQDETDAYAKCSEIPGGKVVLLDTRDKSRAVSIIKNMYLGQTHDLDGAMHKWRHAL